MNLINVYPLTAYLTRQFHKRPSNILIAEVKNRTKYKPKEIVVVPNTGLGDLLQTTSVFQLAKTYMEDVKIYALVYTKYHRELLLNNPFVDATVKYNLRSGEGRLRGIVPFVGNYWALRNKSDLFFLLPSDWMTEDMRKLIVRLNPRYNQIGLGEGDVPQYIFYQQAFADFFNLPLTVHSPALYLSCQERDLGKRYLTGLGLKKAPFVFLAYDTGMDYKCLSSPSLSRLCSLFLDMGLNVILLRGIRRPDTVNQVAERLHNGIHMFESSSLRKIAAVIASCDLVVTPDTFTSHISGALNVPCIVLFGPSHIRFKPPGDNVYVLSKAADCAYRNEQGECFVCRHGQYNAKINSPAPCMDWFKLNEIGKVALRHI